MNARMLVIFIVAAAIVYKLIGMTMDTDAPTDTVPSLMEPEPADNPAGIDPDIGPGPAAELSTTDSSGENLTALAYVRKYGRHYCGPDAGWMLNCSFRNRGDRTISQFTVRIRASSHILDTTDYEGTDYKSYDLEVSGPFPAGERSHSKVKLPTGEDLQWVSTKSTVIAAEY